MKERPMLMSEPMVISILDGSKTETRRIVKEFVSPDTEFVEYYLGRWQAKRKSKEIEGLTLFCGEWRDRYGEPGDQIWVKETYWTDIRDPKDVVIYAATPAQHKYRLRGFVETESQITTEYLDAHEFWVRRPSIFMWRWASRLTLEIKATRVERLNDITEEGAKAEGVSNFIEVPVRHPLNHKQIMHYSCRKGTYREAYSVLWDKINGRGSWAKNPWVTVIQFSKL